MNLQIRVPQVRVLDEDGNQLGVLPTHEALRQAQERGLDLVEVAPTSAPPVCKYLNYGQYKYELQKKEKDSKKRQKTVDLKELRCTPKIGEADLLTKIRQAHKFLSAGDRVKFSVKFRGREATHPEIGRAILTRVVEGLSDVAQLERPPLLEGRFLSIQLLALPKAKGREPSAASSATLPEPTASSPEGE
ncbi:MAG: translation initiation factor IF-3 [Candidatus Limnocylindrus sp.]|uniref:translation initiation factor IF-3 n=1 Tax=Candidatus Limnocylindrus sp. TaxID=2802978 RepID=UPI003B9D8728